jgi:SAM-dependent methyltransferase
MEPSAEQFYDRLSGDYHLLFQNWSQSVRWQGEVLDRLLRDQLGHSALTILDCCCGIGTQAIGLALRGHAVHATDLSSAAVARAQQEARVFGVDGTFGVADVRLLSTQVAGTFDAVLACDNALPHLLTDEDLRQGVRGMTAKLRPGGLFLASIRDYDALVQERPQVTPPRLHEGPDSRQVVFQVWDWSADGKSYQVTQFIVRQAGADCQTSHYTTHYRALRRAELDEALHEAGLAQVSWQMPDESGYYQPLVTARKTKSAF